MHQQQLTAKNVERNCRQVYLKKKMKKEKTMKKQEQTTVKKQRPIQFTFKGVKYGIEFMENNYIFTSSSSKATPSYFNRIDHLLMHIMSVLSRQSRAGTLHEFMEDLKEVIHAVKTISLHIYTHYTPETELEKATTRWGKSVDEALTKIATAQAQTKHRKKKGTVNANATSSKNNSVPS
jgi:hypothetical protein